jgi:hypothetical protein
MARRLKLRADGSIPPMSQQADRHEVMIRCAVCQRLRPGYATALLRMVPVPGAARWQVYRLERVKSPREPIRLDGTWQLGNPHFGFAAEDGTLPAPWVLPVFLRDPPRSLQVECRGCRRSPFEVRHMAHADRAEARGERDAYV